MFGSLSTNYIQPLTVAPFSAPCPFLFREAKLHCWDQHPLHRQHWMCCSRCEHFLVQPESADEVLTAALCHGQRAFKALSGHVECLLL